MSKSAESKPSHSHSPLAEVGVIGLVPDVWGGPWQPRHQILTRLSQYFNVVWCDPVRGWRELWPRTAPQKQNVEYSAAVPPGLAIYRSEKWLLQFGQPRFLAHWSMRQQLHRAQRILLQRGCRKTILYLWRPHYELALDLIDHDLSCYHLDDEYTFSEVERPLEEHEARLIARVDQVFIHSPALLEKKGRLNPQTTFVPNGVDYRAYVTSYDEPADLQPIPHPRIGYVGVIKTQLDIALLIALARRHRQWSFVLVGPLGNLGEDAPLIQELLCLSNVYFLGGKPVGVLPAYTQHLDVCIMCYKINGYTKFIYPLKLHEYLASGPPVVGVPIRSLEEFAPVIRLAQTLEEWSQALSESLASAACSKSQIEARRRVACQHEWNGLVARIAHTMCSLLGPSYLRRFEKILSSEWTGSPSSSRNDSRVVAR